MADKPTKPETSPTTSTDAPSTQQGGSPDAELSAWEIMQLREANLTPSQRRERDEELKREEEMLSKGTLQRRVSRHLAKNPRES